MKQFHLNGVHSCISFDFSFTDFLLVSFLLLLSTTLHLYINQSRHHIGMDCIAFQQLCSFSSEIRKATFTRNLPSIKKGDTFTK